MPFLERRDAQIYYEAKGQGDAIVFAHGAGGNAAIWFNQMAAFSDSHKTIAYDHRYFGRSSCQVDLTIDDFREDLLAILDELNIEKAHLVGQSMGGFTCLRTALDVPERVLSLTMSCTSGGIHNPEPTDAVRDLAASTDRGTSGVLKTMSRASAAKAELMQLYESINNFNTEFSWDKLSTLLGPEGVVQWEQLNEVQCSTLFISGLEDPLFPPDQLKQFVPYFRSARIELVEDAGHSPYFEQPEVFNELLRQHIESAN